ncbi:hypothetical protein [Melissospora conviva]|uniref:hypothetical protein n=1 Tax=Melissospora conviva TaxID=3388432 RepID=UPI003C135951
MNNRSAGDSSMRVWDRWRQLDSAPEDLRVALLATYTVEPLVPHLGVGLHDGVHLTSRIRVGPFNQIVQQCVDDDGDVARWGPDVLVVAPRFEEVWPVTPVADDTSVVDHGAELQAIVATALAAATRWRAYLVVVLPALPDERPYGVGDDGSRFGVVATATAVREGLRRLVADRPNVGVVDAEAIVRGLGREGSYHPVLWHTASIPYTEAFFAALADRLVRLLRVRYRPRPRAVRVDVDSLLTEQVGADEETRFGAELLGPLLAQMRRAGVVVTLDSERSHERAATLLRAVLGDRWTELADDWRFGQGRDDDLLAPLLTVDGLPGGSSAGEPVVALGEDPELWATRLSLSAVLDGLPVPREDDADPGGDGTPAVRAPMSLRDYVAGLDVSVRWQPLSSGTTEQAVDLVTRAKDFTLGIPFEEVRGATSIDDGLEIWLGSVRDRIGDYGIGVAIGGRVVGAVCRVELFSVSCPVLGKNVEQEALRRLAELARRRGCAELSFSVRDTGRNGQALRLVQGVVSGEADTDLSGLRSTLRRRDAEV